MQEIVLKTLLTNENYARQVVSHLKEEFFEGKMRTLYRAYSEFYIENNVVPTVDVMEHLITQMPKVRKEEFSELSEFIHNAYDNPVDDRVTKYLVEKTESWGLERSVYNAILNGISEFENPDKNFGKVYTELRDAVAYGFNNSLGLSYMSDIDERYRLYTDTEAKKSFGLKFMDDNTDGGYENGTLNVVVGGSGSGKSIFLTNIAATAMLRGENVIYFTLEMAEKKIAARIDAKLLSIPVWEVTKQSKNEFESAMTKIKRKTTGDLIIKQYPPNGASSIDFRGFIDELKLKKNFTPDLIIVDYIGITADARGGKGENTYLQQKHVAEDLRAIGIDYDIPVFSGAQLNRGGYDNSSVSLSNISDSMAIAHTADAMFSLYSNEELEESNQAIITFLKNRYGPVDVSGPVGLNKGYMNFYDIESKSYNVDHSSTGNKTKELVYSQRTTEKSDKASGFKFG